MNAVAIDLENVPDATGEVGYSGFVHGVALVDLLQIFHYSRRSLTLHIEPDSAIYLRDGEVIHARSGNLDGESAISSLLARSGGRIRTAEPEEAPTSIGRPFNFLVLDALRGMDEAQRDEADAWPEESGEFTKEIIQVPRRSLFPSVPAAGGQLLATACMQLADRIAGTRAVALLDLKEQKLVVNCGSVDRHLLQSECVAAFDRPALNDLDEALAAARIVEADHAGPQWLEEVRYVGEGGLFFGKALSVRAFALVLCVCGSDSPGVAWAELRQSARMVEKLLP